MPHARAFVQFVETRRVSTYNLYATMNNYHQMHDDGRVDIFCFTKNMRTFERIRFDGLDPETARFFVRRGQDHPFSIGGALFFGRFGIRVSEEHFRAPADPPLIELPLAVQDFLANEDVEAALAADAAPAAMVEQIIDLTLSSDTEEEDIDDDDSANVHELIVLSDGE